MKSILWLLLALLTISIFSCSKSIKVNKRSYSSELLDCKIMFGESISELKFLNSCLLQVGIIDTNSEQKPLKVAIIMIGNQNYVLKEIKTIHSNEQTEKEYSGDGYNITLLYKEKAEENSKVTYEGQFTVRDSVSSSVYKVVGTQCNL